MIDVYDDDDDDDDDDKVAAIACQVIIFIISHTKSQFLWNLKQLFHPVY